MPRQFSLYLHVPFCAQKCPYCDFNTYATPKVPEREYGMALRTEITRYAADERFQGREIYSIFFGGGTPSLLSPSEIGRILDHVAAHFSVAPGAEVTLEANPSAPTVERFAEFKQAGINRVSFGVQSFAPETLALLGRDHTSEEATRAVECAVGGGIHNVSLDIIYGVPNQSVAALQSDLRIARGLPLTHLSTYALSIEPGTPFFQRHERGLLATPDDETVAAMMDVVPLELEPYGFTRYEISNYARPGFESQHNTIYWTGGDYVGVGAGAHSYCATYNGDRLESALRWSTLANPQAYMAAVEKGAAVSWREPLTAKALSFEFFYLGLRRIEGVRHGLFRERFGYSWDEAFGEVISELIAEGFIKRDELGVALTSEGIKLSDSVFERLAIAE